MALSQNLVWDPERRRGHHIGAEMSPRLLVGKSFEAHWQCRRTKWQAIPWEGGTMVSLVSSAILGPRLQIVRTVPVIRQPRLGNWSANDCSGQRWNNALE